MDLRTVMPSISGSPKSNNIKSIFDFESKDVVISDYVCGDKLSFDIAV